MDRLLIFVAGLMISVLPLQAAERSNDWMVATMSEDLQESSPESIRSTATALRKSLDRSDPEDMFAYVHATRLLISHGLAISERASRGQRKALKEAIMPVTYNLAADTWSGWGEVLPEPDYQRLGLQAARLNLSLRQQLKPDPKSLFRGNWIVGAHLLAAQDYSGALESFSNCHALAIEASDQESALMTMGWFHVTNILRGQDEQRLLGMIQSQLRSRGKDGTFYAAQYDAALKVFKQ